MGSKLNENRAKNSRLNVSQPQSRADILAPAHFLHFPSHFPPAQPFPPPSSLSIFQRYNYKSVGAKCLNLRQMAVIDFRFALFDMYFNTLRK